MTSVFQLIEQKGGNSHSPDVVVQAVYTFMETGSPTKVSNATGVPRGTVRHWITCSWFQEALEVARSDAQLRLDGKITGCLDKAAEKLVDRIENGDIERVKGEEGWEEVRTPMKGRDLAYSMKGLYEIRALVRGGAPSQKEKSSLDERLEKIVGAMEKIAKTRVGEVVDGEITEINP